MKAFFCVLFALFATQICQAQIVVNVYDNEGTLVGLPDLSAQNTRQHMIFRPDAIGVVVDFITGELKSIATNNLLFDQLDCQGQAYVEGSPMAFDWISPYSSEGPPEPLFLIEQDATYSLKAVKSRATSGTGGCVNSEDSATVASVTIITDPTEYGLVITPSGNWGYSPPLDAKTATIPPKGEIIYCDSFENCPAQ